MKLIEAEIPRFSPTPTAYPQHDAAEYDRRLERTRAAMDRLGLSHLIVYGDREHSANLAWLTGFDPRFEEAVLILRLDAAPLIVVGTECESYLPISPLFRSGRRHTTTSEIRRSPRKRRSFDSRMKDVPGRPTT